MNINDFIQNFTIYLQSMKKMLGTLGLITLVPDKIADTRICQSSVGFITLLVDYVSYLSESLSYITCNYM